LKRISCCLAVALAALAARAQTGGSPTGADIEAPASSNAPPAAAVPQASAKPRPRYYTMETGWTFGTPTGPRSLSLPADPAEAAPSAWRRRVEAGMSVQRGNSDIELYALEVSATKRAETHATELSAGGSYGEDDGQRNRETAGARARHRRDSSACSYSAVEGRYYYDAIADVDYQVVGDWVVGYDLVRSAEADAGIEAGPAYVRERKGGEESSFVAARIAVMAETLFGSQILIWERVDFLPSLEDTSVYVLTAEAGMESALNSRLSVKVALQDRYDSAPAEEKKRNDLITTLSLVAGF
jgi:putative salt-induced outer membrane protein YdiY